MICRRLDGIPLALELAAARSRSLTRTELAERVQDRFGVLTSGSRTADARQQTLRATVDWSHDLLTVPERVLFRRLAVFHGGWTLAAAEAVVPTGEPARGCGPGPAGPAGEAVLGGGRTPAPTAPDTGCWRRCGSTPTTGWTDAGERERVAAAHAGYYLELGERAESGLRGPVAGALGADPAGGTSQSAGGPGLVDGDRRAGGRGVEPGGFARACTGIWDATSRVGRSFGG